MDPRLRERTQALFAGVTSHRIFIYTLVSTVAVTAALANAAKNNGNFYSIAVFLSKSSRSVLILANFTLLIALSCGRIVQQIFFGPLRGQEVERLYDRLWYFVTESLLAFTIFRDDFDIPFGLMFGFLLFVKSFHWLVSDRIEWMEQQPYPGPPLLFHARMSSLFLILWSIDFIMIVFAIQSTLTYGVDGKVLFASEYAILIASALNTISKYALACYDLRRAGQRGGEEAPPWENKSMWIFYVELATDFLKLTTYLLFFLVIMTFYGLPLNIIRDVYMTAHSFITRLRALHRYQTATKNMDERYPDATLEEMAALNDHTCIICRDEMVHPRAQAAPGDAPIVPAPQIQGGLNVTPKKLPCGHILHFHCLRSWLERQQSCPTCRRTVLDDAQPGAANGAPGAARPAAGAAPVPNPFAPQPPAPANAQNRAGILNRLLGPRAGGPAPQPHGMPPGLLPAQAGGAAAPANGIILPPNLDLGWGPGQLPPGGVTVQYMIEYQIGRGPRPGAGAAGALPAQGAVPVARPLQPAPRFAGFQGADGVWQPWEVDQRLLGEGQPPVDPANVPLPAPTPTVERPHPTPTVAEPNPAVTTETPTPTTTETPSTTTPETTTTDVDAPPNPREAAAAAALRRFQRPPVVDSSSTPTVPVSATENATSTTVPPTAADSTPAATAIASPLAEVSTPRLALPTMIPMFTPAPPPAQPRPSRTSSSTTTPVARAVPAQPSHARTQAHLQALSAAALRTEPPPAVTEEQLAVMDRLTREAIDERLRVLEGVSNTVFRCVEDLMRMRSQLPAASAPAPPVASGSGGPPVAAAAATTSDAIAPQAIDPGAEAFRAALGQMDAEEASRRAALSSPVEAASSSPIEAASSSPVEGSFVDVSAEPAPGAGVGGSAASPA